MVAAPDRDPADRKLDAGRKPAEMLEFLGVRPGMKVEDMGAGGGYTTELLARAVAPGGVVYMQNDPRWMSFLKEPLAKRFTHPAMKDVVRADVPFDDPIPSGISGLDLVVLNVIYHDIANMPVDRVRMNEIVFNALKPGGAYVVIDSSAKPGSGLSATQSLHRIDEDVVKQEVEKAGFKLAQEGDFLRNPDDARDWNSSPQAAEKAGKRGQSDRFALKFVRPQGSRAQIVPPHLRLPEGPTPARVTAELTVDPTKESFEGSEEIELSLDEPTPILWLNADLLDDLRHRAGVHGHPGSAFLRGAAVQGPAPEGKRDGEDPLDRQALGHRQRRRVSARGERRLVRAHPGRAAGNAPRVPLFRRAALQDSLAHLAAGAEGGRRVLQHPASRAARTRAR